METIIETIFSNSIYIFIAGILSLFIVYTIIKKILKLTFFFCLLLFFYILYVNHVSGEFPKSVEELKKSVSINADKVKSIATESIDEAKTKTSKIIEKKVDEKVEEFFE